MTRATPSRPSHSNAEGPKLPCFLVMMTVSARTLWRASAKSRYAVLQARDSAEALDLIADVTLPPQLFSSRRPRKNRLRSMALNSWSGSKKQDRRSRSSSCQPIRGAAAIPWCKPEPMVVLTKPLSPDALLRRSVNGELGVVSIS
jgi:hypothetical protein